MLGRIFTNVASKVATRKKKKKKKKKEEGITSDHLLEFASRIVERSNIKPRVPTNFCSGRKFPDGTECMCATYLKNVDAAAAVAAAAVEGNLEEEFKFGHEAREKLLVSVSKCKMCPPTEPPPPKKTKKKEEEEKEGKEEKKEEEEKKRFCPGFTCFNGCVSEKEETVDGHGAAGACSKCNRVYNNLAAESKRSKKGPNGRTEYMKDKYPHVAYDDEKFLRGRISMPFPKERELLKYYGAGRCGLCDRIYVALQQEWRNLKVITEENSDQYDVVKVFGRHYQEHLKQIMGSQSTEANRRIRKRFISRVEENVTNAVRGVLKDDHVEVCCDCVVAVTVGITKAFAEHVGDNALATRATLEDDVLVSKAVQAVERLDFDQTKKGAIEMEYGKAWQSDTNDRSADSSDFSLKYQLPRNVACRLAFHWIRISESNVGNKTGVLEDFDNDAIATLGRQSYKRDTKLVIPGTHDINGEQVVSPLYICAEPFMKTGPYSTSLFFRAKKYTSSVDSDVPSWKELVESANDATAFNELIVVSIVMNSPEDLTGDFNNLYTALSVFESPERVFLVWKNARAVGDLSDGFGGTVSIRVLMSFMNLRINFDAVSDSDKNSNYNFHLGKYRDVGDDFDFFAAAKFLSLIESGRVAMRRGKNINQRRSTMGGVIMGRATMGTGKDEIFSQEMDEFDVKRAQSSQDSSTEDTTIKSTGEMYILSWGAKPLKRLPGKDPTSPNEFFSKKTLEKVKLRAGFEKGNLTKEIIQSPNKKRTTPKVESEEKSSKNEKKQKKKK
ncbi:unnamed protein product [Bathycoccus prasinos]